jgi:hypothetical protein
VKPSCDWHRTKPGRVLLFLGGIRLAIPVLVSVACALAYGTWIESSGSAAKAGELVYGSWWFIALMLLVCLSLVLSVATRYPWRRKHVGFIMVHASLILLIGAAFVSFFTKIEGKIVLSEGEQSAAIQLESRQIEVLEHGSGEFVVEQANLIDKGAEFTTASTVVRVREFWDNTSHEMQVTNDGVNALHAVELRPGNGEANWIGQSDPASAPFDLDGVYIRVMPAGEKWVQSNTGVELMLATQDGDPFPVPAAGSRIEGSEWSVVSVERFERATVSSDLLEERETGAANPAAMIQLAHDDGSVERLIAFERFADSVHKKTLEGETHSPYALRFVGSPSYTPLISFELNGEESSVVVVGEAGDIERFDRPSEGEWIVESEIVGTFAVMQQLSHARGAKALVKAHATENNQPALVIEYEDAAGLQTSTLPWSQAVPIQFGDEIRMLRYGPVLEDIPFGIELADFRKMDYPGTESAMAYESDVLFSLPGTDSSQVTISMNKPLEHDGWKVYQAGFVGNTISVFQVTRDPGLIPTYIACTTLCIGIVITFYSRSLSHGHPGMPAPFSRQTKAKGAVYETSDVRPVPAPARVDVCVVSRDDKHEGHGGHPDPAPRPGHAVGHVRKPGRGSADRSHEMV